MLHYRHTISPYMGETLRGRVHGTWLRGERIFTHAEAGDVFASTPRGREYALSCDLSRR
jgi:allantoinase